MRKLHVLDPNVEDGIRVSCISWSSNGSVIAVSYEHTDHTDWCDHQTMLAIWNIRRRDFNPGTPFYQVGAS